MPDVIRLIAGGLLALICCWAGVMVKRHYKERESFYLAAKEFAGHLGSDLGFKKTPLPASIESFLTGKKGGFHKLLNDYLISLRSGKAKLDFDAKGTVKLKEGEKKELNDFFLDLGKTSLADQLANIKRAEEEFEKKRSKCKEESVRLGGMYFKLLVLLGIALIVILA